ncbi:EGF-like domain-containing protein [Trichonephila clavipes]|nr:EGF-like domain-containing protein [Trichonephila clavipes]
MTRNYSVKRQDHVFYNILDLTGINSWILYKEVTDLCNPETCFHGRCEFLTNSKVERNYRCICDAGYTGLRCETKIVDNSGELIRFAILVSINIVLFILISAMFCFLCAKRNKQMK